MRLKKPQKNIFFVLALLGPSAKLFFRPFLLEQFNNRHPPLVSTFNFQSSSVTHKSCQKQITTNYSFDYQFDPLRKGRTWDLTWSSSSRPSSSHIMHTHAWGAQVVRTPRNTAPCSFPPPPSFCHLTPGCDLKYLRLNT